MASTLEVVKQMESIPYASVVGSLIYVMIGSRPNLAYAVGIVSIFMSKLRMDHWSDVKWILRYLIGKLKASFTFVKGSNFVIEVQLQEGPLQDIFSRCGEIHDSC